MAKTHQDCLGLYRLLNVIHTGHGSQLWQGYDDGKQRKVAIKAIPEKDAKNRSLVRYLEQEYKVGRDVIHPRIIEVYAFDVDRGIPYLAMEWFAAPNLKTRIRDKEAHDNLMLLAPKIVEQAAEALGFMHSKGWVHRDIKPENFLVADDGQVKLIDFGLAQRPQGILSKLLSFTKQKRQGTPSYMSPEQIRCEALDQRSDVYSFGCVIYEMIAGIPPITGATREELLSRALRAAPPALEAANHDVTAEFSQLVRRCLSKDPKARPASAAAFLGEFQSLKVFKTQPRRPKPAT